MTAPSLSLLAPALQAISLEGVSHPVTEASLAEAHRAFSDVFGEQVSLQDLVNAFEGGTTNLAVESLSLASIGPDRYETRADFRGVDEQIRGTCSYIWRRLADGSLARTKEASLKIDGAHKRLSLQIHGNLMEFSRKSGVVREFIIEARDVGRYAYRFMNGVEIDPATLKDVRQGILQNELLFHVSIDQTGLSELRSPRDVSDFLVLPQIDSNWMTKVDEIIHRHGYQFTVDQVVDVARRPGLALLLDRPSYSMQLNLRDKEATTQFYSSIKEGRNSEALRRIRGVLGTDYSHLPKDVRNALIVYRPFLFPRPKNIPPLPDLSHLSQPESPYHVVGYRSKDGRLLRSLPADPQGTSLGDYRSAEVKNVIDAIDAGTAIVSATGLSGSGKSEVLIWNLEKSLSQRGHRVVALEANKLGGQVETRELLRRIDDVVQPTVVIFDESVFISGPRKIAFIEFAKTFLNRPGQHIVFVGGGVISPEEQRIQIERNLEELWKDYSTAHVTLYPKPLNLAQTYRFLGLARIDWADEATRIGLLMYVLKRYPPYLIPFVPIRFHEHPEIESVTQAQALIDAEVDPAFWAGATLMVIDGFSPPLREGE